MTRLPSTLLLASLALLSTWSPLRAEILVKSGEKIAFLGDSITAGGWSSPVGYVKLVIAGLEANGVKAEPIPAGISGHKSNQMLARLQKDVLDKKPHWMTLSCGVNDVWHGKNGIPLDVEMAKTEPYASQADIAARGTYKKNITDIVDKAQAAGAKPVILTATVIQEKLDNDLNAKLAPYNDFLRGLAKEKKVALADLNQMFQDELKKANKPDQKVLTSDGVHMNPAGNRLMAVGVLKALGLNDAQLEKAKVAWDAIVVPPPAPKPAAAPKPATPAAGAPAPAAPAVTSPKTK
jgi:lysophospholipase L1-like esterase